MCPCGEAELGYGGLQQLVAMGVEPAVSPCLPMAHVGIVAGAAAVEAAGLHPAGTGDLVADLGAGCAGRVALQFAIGDGGHFDVNVDSVE